MKRCVVILFFLFSLQLIAQPAVKVYAFSQTSMPGMVPQRDIPSENGRDTLKRQYDHTISFLIYLSSAKNVTIQPKQVWIGSKWFKTRYKRVNPPIRIEKPAKKLLVPYSSNKTIQVTPDLSAPITKKASSGLKKMMTSSELIICYEWKSKLYYLPLKKITVLDPILGE